MPFDLETELELPRTAQIDWCELRIEGYELVDLPDGRRRRESLVAPIVIRLCEARTFERGLTTLACRAEIADASCPPSFVGSTCRVAYEAHVHASVPWWPDARASFSLNVVAPVLAPLEGSPRVSASRGDGPAAGVPYLEMAVATDVVDAGGIVEGALSLRGARGARFATVAAVARETFLGSLPQRGAAYEVQVAVPPDADGDVVPFRLRLPTDLTPSFVGRTFHVGYALEVDVRGPLHSMVVASLPLTVTPRGGARRPSSYVPPHVGDARLMALFELVAQTRGHSIEPGPTLVIRRDAIEARIEHEVRPEGTFLVLTARYPSLHLGLSVYEAGRVARLVRGRVETGDPEFDGAHVVDGREPAQVARLMEPLAPLLAGLSRVEMRDDALTASARTIANDRASIDHFVQRAEAILARLAAPPPMPSAFEAVEIEWATLAQWLAGTFEPGHARVRGTCGASRVDVVTAFERDVPRSTTIQISPDRPTTGELYVGARSEVPLIRGISPDARAVLDRLARCGSIEVTPRATRIGIDAPLAGAFSPKRVRPMVEDVVRLHEALKPMRGPFR